MVYLQNITYEELAEYYRSGVPDSFVPNVKFRTEEGHILKEQDGKLIEVHPYNLWGISTKHNPEQSMALADILDDSINLIALTGHAGTGKTFIALLGALWAGHSNIIFTREVQQVGKEMGFLKGGISEKFMPYMRPFFDNIEVIGQYAGKPMEGRVTLEPLQFMRGSSLLDTILIVDEAQNCSVEVLKMAISRAGKGSKVILSGSMNQIDGNFTKENNGLATVIRAFTGQRLFSHVHLVHDERSELARLADELL